MAQGFDFASHLSCSLPVMVMKSKRSGGPKTSEGKLVASRNAIKTGAYANITVLPGEDLEQFKELEEQFFKDFAPSDLAESTMVRELTSLTWKKIRLERFEHTALIRVMNQNVSFIEASTHFNSTLRQSAEWVFRQIDNAGPVWAKEGSTRKDFANKMKSADRRTLDLEQLERESANFFSVLTVCAEESGLTDLKTAIISGKVNLLLRPAIALWDYAIETAIKEAEDILWVVQNKAELLAAIQCVKDQRLVDFVVGEKLRRAHDDLSRAFYKALSELRKHQEWRRNRPIDITPEPALSSSDQDSKPAVT
jgi:hypothetical protein